MLQQVEGLPSLSTNFEGEPRVYMATASIHVSFRLTLEGTDAVASGLPSLPEGGSPPFMKPTKHKIGFWLLISLIPTALVFIISLAGSLAANNESESWTAILGLSMFYGIIVLPVGVILLIWGNIEFNRAYNAAQRYAERNGWHPISRTSWRNRKRNNIALSVAQAFKQTTYILNIDMDGETVTVDEFETSLWALQFGDWLWQDLLQTNTEPTRIEIEEKRAEWEQSRELAVYNPGQVGGSI